MNTITAPAEVDATTITEITGITDEMIINTAKAQKITKVPAGIARETNRAWSYRGNID